MPVIVYATTGSRKEADMIARTLVGERLAACVNTFPVKSTYVWKKKTVRSNEHVLLCKTTKNKFNKVRDRIRKLHSYETPCILLLKIDAGDAEFLDWIKESVR